MSHKYGHRYGTNSYTFGASPPQQIITAKHQHTLIRRGWRARTHKAVNNIINRKCTPKILWLIPFKRHRAAQIARKKSYSPMGKSPYAEQRLRIKHISSLEQWALKHTMIRTNLCFCHPIDTKYWTLMKGDQRVSILIIHKLHMQWTRFLPLNLKPPTSSSSHIDATESQWINKLSCVELCFSPFHRQICTKKSFVTNLLQQKRYLKK